MTLPRKNVPLRHHIWRRAKIAATKLNTSLQTYVESAVKERLAAEAHTRRAAREAREKQAVQEAQAP